MQVAMKGLVGRAGIFCVVKRKLLPSLEIVKLC